MTKETILHDACGAPHPEKPGGSASDKLTVGRLKSWSLVVAVNDEHVFQNTLLRSPAIDERCQVIVERGFDSAGKAYNAGLRDAKHDVVVFCHQDVYLPDDWTSNLERALERLDLKDPNWGVLGVAGIDRQGEFVGHVHSTGLKRTLGGPFNGEVKTLSVDELLFVVRRSSGLSFDESVPGFHLYGTDICLEARRRGLWSYIIPAFCIHNSVGVRFLSRAFWCSYMYMRTKWWSDLPITTCCTTLTKFCWPVLQYIIVRTRDRLVGSINPGQRSSDPGLLYKSIAATQNSNIQGEHRTL